MLPPAPVIMKKLGRTVMTRRPPAVAPPSACVAPTPPATSGPRPLATNAQHAIASTAALRGTGTPRMLADPSEHDPLPRHGQRVEVRPRTGCRSGAVGK